jgi:hypothetical protein
MVNSPRVVLHWDGWNTKSKDWRNKPSFLNVIVLVDTNGIARMSCDWAYSIRCLRLVEWIVNPTHPDTISEEWH